MHKSTDLSCLFKRMKKFGFKIEKSKSNVIRIIPPNKGRIYITHGTDKAYHPMIRDFKKFYNVDLLSEK